MSLDFRRDNRSIDQFARHIDLETAKQRIWADILQVFFEEKTGVPCRKIEHGVDNDGSLIEGNLLNDNVDNIFIIKNKACKIEIKTVPEYLDKFMTFKTSSLKSCVRQVANIVVPKRNQFYFYTFGACQHLLEHYNQKIYEKFSPNDLAVRIFKQDIDKLVENKMIIVKTWSDQSKKLVEENWSFLSKDRN